MAIFSFLHRPEPKRFTYKPRYYDPDKEKDAETGHVPDETELFARRLHRSWESKRTARNESKRKSSSRAILWSVVILALLLYVIYKL